jgi:hypothetical protein
MARKLSEICLSFTHLINCHIANPMQVEAWPVLFEMLQLDSLDSAARMFAATSLKGKVRLADC